MLGGTQEFYPQHNKVYLVLMKDPQIKDEKKIKDAIKVFFL